ncbi:MAG: LAGLIDADG family homing endonuclease, partial [Candidatus Paceibacterota bacterium]
VPRTLPVSSKTSVPEQKAAALGYLIAEGHLTHPHGVYFYAKEQAELQDFSANVRAFDNVSLTKSTKHGVGALYVGRSNRTQENRIFSWLRSIGAHGKTATKKRIPECVFTWDQKAQAVCLGKMWQGDGAVSITNEQLFYATSSYGLARDVQHLLLRFDILSTIHTKQFRYRGGYKQGYTIVVSHRDNIIRFFETVGKHLISAKQSALKTLAERAYDNRETQGVYYARGTSDTVPASVRTTVRQEMRVHGYTVQTVSKATGIAVRSFSYDARKKGFQRGLLATVAETLESKEVAKYAEADVYWDTVVSIEYAGTEMTYDLTVPVHHNFVANDIYVHNSHAASYGRVAYQTAYMKANYPAAFMSAVMTAESGDTDKIAATVAECTRMGLEVLPPDINESRGDFTVVRDTDTEEPRKTSDPRSEKIRFGLYTIKNVGEGIANAIIAERDRGGKFASLADFLTRVEDRNLNRRTLESLIKTGAFDNLGERGQMLANIDYLMKYHKEASNQPEGQDSLFGLLSDQSSVPKLTLEESNPADPQEKLSWEKELIGLYISGHPLDSFQDKLAEKKLSINDISTNGANKQTVVLGALIEDKKEIFTKKGDRMAFIKLGDYTGSIEAVAFPSVYEKLRATLEPDTCVVIKGTVTKRDGETSIAIDKAKRLGAENKQLEEEPGTAPASQET